MNKKELNNEIILCRPAIRKARVAVIRKVLKKMKILKGCKIESSKEKKLKKAERLFQRVQFMKKAKDDEVTKFALRNTSLENYLKEPGGDEKQKALACLAKHDAVVKKINSIRERIPNWESEIPILLDSLGKKKKPINKSTTVKTNDKTTKDDKKTKSDAVTNKLKDKSEVKKVKPIISTQRKEKTVSKQRKIESDEEKEESEVEINKNVEEDISPKNTKIEKIDDPFFIEKKVIAPKLLTESVQNRKFDNEKDKFRRDTRTSVFNAKPFKVKRESSNRFAVQKSVGEFLEQKEEKLHPSWAAKKVKLIKPFEGKKIKFSDE